MTLPHYPERLPASDEIDLFELFQALWSQKLLIVLVTLVVTAIAGSYAFLAKPVYEAKVGLLPPRLSDISDFNSGRGEAKLKVFTVEDVYRVFTRNLASESLRRKFFNEVFLPSLEPGKRETAAKDMLWKSFNEGLTVKAPDKQQPELFEVTVSRNDPGQVAEWANFFVASAAEKALQDMQDNVRVEISSKAQAIERKIEILRESAIKRREDRIAHLQEALVVARAVGQQEPQVVPGRIASDGDLSAFVDGSLLYMHGARAIQTELEVLKGRKSDDPYISELRGLQDQLQFLKGIKASPDNVAVFTLDSTAQVPETPVKPKKALILALGVVLGGMLGLFVALVRNLLRRKTGTPLVQPTA